MFCRLFSALIQFIFSFRNVCKLYLTIIFEKLFSLQLEHGCLRQLNLQTELQQSNMRLPEDFDICVTISYTRYAHHIRF